MINKFNIPVVSNDLLRQLVQPSLVVRDASYSLQIWHHPVALRTAAIYCSYLLHEVEK